MTDLASPEFDAGGFDPGGDAGGLAPLDPFNPDFGANLIAATEANNEQILNAIDMEFAALTPDPPQPQPFPQEFAEPPLPAPSPAEVAAAEHHLAEMREEFGPFNTEGVLDQAADLFVAALSINPNADAEEVALLATRAAAEQAAINHRGGQFANRIVDLETSRIGGQVPREVVEAFANQAVVPLVQSGVDPQEAARIAVKATADVLSGGAGFKSAADVTRYYAQRGNLVNEMARPVAPVVRPAGFQSPADVTAYYSAKARQIGGR